MRFVLSPRRSRFKLLPVTDALRVALDSSGYSIADDPELLSVIQALQDGKFILAVKHYREATGVGLKAAKEAVEAIEAVLSS